ncbi:MAG: hypothetical protein ACT4P2_15805 [Pseudomonadota bacterium]
MIPGKPTYREMRYWWLGRRPARAPQTQFSMLLADLEGDQDLRQTKLLFDALYELGAFEVV